VNFGSRFHRFGVWCYLGMRQHFVHLEPAPQHCSDQTNISPHVVRVAKWPQFQSQRFNLKFKLEATASKSTSLEHWGMKLDSPGFQSSADTTADDRETLRSIMANLDELRVPPTQRHFPTGSRRAYGFTHDSNIP
jgi:hypothetical protein